MCLFSSSFRFNDFNCSFFNDKSNILFLIFNKNINNKEITKRSEAGLFSALFIAIVPSYISRSVAGSYDNEGVAIFALVFSFYTFLKAVNTVILIYLFHAQNFYFRDHCYGQVLQVWLISIWFLHGEDMHLLLT